MGASPSASTLFAAASTKTETVLLVLDGNLLDAHARADLDLTTALAAGVEGDSGEAVALAERVADLEKEMDAAAVEFTFKGIGRGRWRKLMADHPPADADVARGAAFDVEMFPFEAMAASIVSPQLTVDDLIRLNDEVLDESQYRELWGACLAANLGSGATRPESEAARSVLRNARPSSAQPSDSESPAAS